MSTSYDEAVTALYQAPHESFVAERRRLSAELKAGGDKATAAQLAKLARPSTSAWAVNQLWWHARQHFEELFETAGQLRAGKLAASGAHRQALAKLSARARKLLADSGHAASEGTLRRVEMTLSGLAAAGSFDPEPAGALTKDRDPPGFEAFGIGAASESDEPVARTAHPHPKSKAETPSRNQHAETKRREHAEAQRARDQAAAERKREAEDRAKRQAARRELEVKVREAKDELAERERERTRIAKELAAAEREVERAREASATAEAKLASVDKG
jgi:hypothetical protein